MLEKMVKIDDDNGIKLIEEGKYEEAQNFFKSRLHLNNHLVYYGLATAIFKENRSNMTKEETNKVIKLYQESIELNPDFADTHLMLGMAYEQIVSILINDYKKSPYSNSDQKVGEIKIILDLAKKSIKRAVELNPNFHDISQSELNSFERKLIGIDNLKQNYNERIRLN